MLNRDLKPLYQKLEQAKKDVLRLQDDDDLLAMGNYIGNLYLALACMGDMEIKPDKNKFLGSSENYKRFIDHLNVYNDQLLENFLLNKDFHASYIGEVLPEIEEELPGLCELPEVDSYQLSPQEFADILYGFLESIGLVPLFERYMDEKRIHHTIVGVSGSNLGSTLHNPFRHDTDLFVKQFEPTYNHMTTLVHELGHAYDLEQFHGNIKEYNTYFYLSYYGEVISRLVERLLHRYCLKNGLVLPLVKSAYVDYQELNHDYYICGYILSLLTPEMLKNDCNDAAAIVKQVKDYFIEGSPVEKFVKTAQELSMPEAYPYLYGDVLSMFLADDVEKNGMNSEMMQYFFSHRAEPFQEEFLRECGFGPGNYAKLYRKEVELAKK